LQEVSLNETCNKVLTVKCFYDVHPVKFGLKQKTFQHYLVWNVL